MTLRAVAAEGLGKKYTIARPRSARYETLRDTIASRVGATTAMLTGRRQGGTSESQEFWALRDVSFELQQGAVVGVIGRNGAGKSTLLKLLSRITEPSSGTIRTRGRIGSLLEVGAGFHPELTGRENTYLNGAILGMSRDEVRRKFDDIVSFAEVSEFIDVPVKHYSSGMYVRLAFAVAAFLEPDILLVDEALAVGDVQFQRRSLGRLREVSQADGRTVMFVSHNMASIRTLCPDTIWLHEGRIQGTGKSPDVIRSYLDWSVGESAARHSLGDIHRPSPWHGASLRIGALSFNGGQAIMHGEKLTVEIELQVSAPALDIALQVGFDSPEGLRIMSLDSDLESSREDIAVGRVVVTAEIDRLDLQPGQYLVDVDVRSGDNVRGLDWLPSCAMIQVLPGPQTPSAVFRDTGGVRLPGRWRFLSES